MAYRVEVDKDVCISSGKCVADHPAAFAFDADELAETRSGVADLTDDQLLAVAQQCPSGAIELFTEDGDAVDLL